MSKKKSAILPVHVVHKQSYSDENMCKFKNHLQNIDWFHVHKAIAVDNKFIGFSQTIAELHDAHFPVNIVRNITPRKQGKPWITSGILNPIKSKDKKLYAQTFYKIPITQN